MNRRVQRLLISFLLKFKLQNVTYWTLKKSQFRFYRIKLLLFFSEIISAFSNCDETKSLDRDLARSVRQCGIYSSETVSAHSTLDLQPTVFHNCPYLFQLFHNSSFVPRCKHILHGEHRDFEQMHCFLLLLWLSVIKLKWHSPYS